MNQHHSISIIFRIICVLSVAFPTEMHVEMMCISSHFRPVTKLPLWEEHVIFVYQSFGKHVCNRLRIDYLQHC